MTLDEGALFTADAAATIDNSITGATGATEMRFRNAGGSWSNWETYSATKAWTLPAGDGDESVFAEYRTFSGNASGAVLQHRRSTPPCRSPATVPTASGSGAPP